MFKINLTKTNYIVNSLINIATFSEKKNKGLFDITILY